MDEASLRIQALETELARLRNELNELRSAQALVAPDYLLRTLMEQSPDQVYFKDLQSRFIRASRTVAEAFQQENPADLLGKSDFDFFSQEHARRAYEDEQEIIRTGVPRIDMEEAATWPDGRTTWISTTKIPFRDAAGSILGTFGISRNITTRKQTEIALRLSEEKLRMVFDHAVDGILMSSPEGLIVAANANACAMTGLAKEELIGSHISHHFSAESLTKVPLRFDLLQAGQRVVSERDLLRGDGSLLPIEMHTKMMPDGTFQAIVRDISERKNAERTLQESEQHFWELLDRLQEGFAFADKDERFVFANPAASAIFGIPGDLVGRNLQEFLEPEVFKEVMRQTEHRKRGEKGQYDLSIRRPDGEPRVIALSVSPWLSEEGEYLGSTGLFQDITERKRAEKALQESETNFRNLLDKLGEGFAVVDAEERCTFANPAAARIFGVDPEQLVGHSIREFMDADTYQKILHQTAQRRGGESGTYEIQIRRPDGEKRCISLSASPFLGDGGEYLGADGLLLDVTERNLAEEALRQAQKLESLGVLAGGIAHDFNNLLTAMLGNLNLAQMKSSQESPALPYLEKVERIVLKAAELAKQMLAYSGRGRFVVKPHDLNQVVQEMAHLLNVSISKKVTLNYDLAHGLPTIEADAAQIQQVVMNLITNASEAIGDQDGSIGVSTRQQTLTEAMLQSAFASQPLQPGTHAILEITDSGSGIDPGILGRIFDPFFSTKHSGRGLGLSAMLGILRGHHAGIQIASEVGKGSTFTLFFPVAPSGQTQTVAQPKQVTNPLQGRVLLVDDEADVREATSAMLEALGLQVVMAVDGQDALDRFLAERGAIDLVLLDLTMPRMDGREAFQELRRIQADIPVILYSGYSKHESLGETLAQGFSGFLQKPFQMAELRMVLQHLLPQA